MPAHTWLIIGLCSLPLLVLLPLWLLDAGGEPRNEITQEQPAGDGEERPAPVAA